MRLEETVPIQFLTQLQPQAVVVVAITVVVLALPEAVAAVAAVADHITPEAVAVVPAQQEEMPQCHQILEVNTALELPDKDIPVVEVAAIFTLRAKAAAD
jgi:hypothetical protein